MKSYYLFTFFTYCFSLIGFEYLSFSGSTYTGYQHDDQSMLTQEFFGNFPQRIEENISLNLWNLGFQAQFFDPGKMYAWFDSCIGFCFSSEMGVEGTFQVSNLDFTVSRSVQTFTQASLNDYQYHLQGVLGYPYRFGPLFLFPLASMYFEKENLSLKRKASTKTVSDSGNTFVAELATNSPFYQWWLTPGAGLQVLLDPWPYSPFRLQTGYIYSWGWMELKRTYSWNTTATINSINTFRHLEDDLKTKSFCSNHRFFFKGSAGFSSKFLLSVMFLYEFRAIEKGKNQVNSKISGIEFSGDSSSNVLIHQNPHFWGGTLQRFSTNLEFSYQF